MKKKAVLQTNKKNIFNFFFQSIRVRKLATHPQQEAAANNLQSQRVKLLCKENAKYEVAPPTQQQQQQQQQHQQQPPLSDGGAPLHGVAPLPSGLPATFNGSSATPSALAGHTSSPPPPPPRAMNKGPKDPVNCNKQEGNGRDPMSNHSAAVAQLATLQRYQQQQGNSGLPGGHHHHHHHHYHSYHQVSKLP